MECSVVLFKPRIHLFACTHPSVSNSLDCNDWLAYKHQSRALCSNTLFLAVYKHQSPLCVSNMCGLWLLVCVYASVSSLSFKHVWMVIPCLSTSLSLLPCVSNTFGFWSLVCVHAPVNRPLFQTRLFVVACLHSSISLEPKWLRVTWIIPCKCLVFHVVGMVMGTSTVA